MPEERLAMPPEERGKVRKIAKSLISFETPIRRKGKPHPGPHRKTRMAKSTPTMVAIGETVIERRSRAFGAGELLGPLSGGAAGVVGGEDKGASGRRRAR